MTDPLTAVTRKKRFIPRLAYGCVGLGLSVIPLGAVGGCGDGNDAVTTDHIDPAFTDFADASVDAGTNTDHIDPCLCDFQDASSDAGDAGEPSDSSDASDAKDAGDAGTDPDAAG